MVFTIDELMEYIDLDLKTWKGDKSQIRWHTVIQAMQAVAIFSF